MSWDAYCNLPSADVACIAGVDGTQWGKKGDWKFASGEGAVAAKPSLGKMVAVSGTKYLIVNNSEGVFFGVKGDNALVIKVLKKCFLAAIGNKGKQGSLIDEINKFADSLAKGGY
mmetsp:Transcript_18542/g.25784  ORF Transcript_18542/g.25784 Transcript_18542/m.25784 type:complete len:115 (-) Transcript_18542:386-730(-)|eukprot:CAMPEP_0184479062 /NCGR_PEP_ID=MMETSP0113_2-20130426/921_1 /TAXON_ID=91329 /ORGANISM="Norrisiella sphaerica, Strain BC52" /LENGTH=114 /DNA_ID=CAMNT_0026857055 /DNA_START=67 /DNA_END=411 /DNA_ORIENTATION=+